MKRACSGFGVDSQPPDIVNQAGTERSQEGFNKTTKVFPSCQRDTFVVFWFMEILAQEMQIG